LYRLFYLPFLLSLPSLAMGVVTKIIKWLLAIALAAAFVAAGGE
jgi:hypothetical protein